MGQFLKIDVIGVLKVNLFFPVWDVTSEGEGLKDGCFSCLKRSLEGKEGEKSLKKRVSLGVEGRSQKRCKGKSPLFCCKGKGSLGPSLVPLGKSVICEGEVGVLCHLGTKDSSEVLGPNTVFGNEGESFSEGPSRYLLRPREKGFGSYVSVVEGGLRIGTINGDVKGVLGLGSSRKSNLAILIENSWIPFDGSLRESTCIQFAINLKRLKLVVIKWVAQKKLKDEQDLVIIENQLEDWYRVCLVNFPDEDIKEGVSLLEKRKRKLLEEEKSVWRLKIKALWKAKGNDNTQFFHNFANHRKNVNIIWKDANKEGAVVSGFEDLSKVGTEHFKSTYKEDNRASIAEVIQRTSFFPSFIGEEDHESLLKEISKEEILEVLQSLQKDKIRLIKVLGRDARYPVIVLASGKGSKRDALKLRELLDLYCLGTRMKGFFLKPNAYGIRDWRWLIAKVEKRLEIWCNRWLSRARREKECIPLVKWQGVATPKESSSWGIKNLHLFGKSLAAKNGWMLITSEGNRVSFFVGGDLIGMVGWGWQKSLYWVGSLDLRSSLLFNLESEWLSAGALGLGRREEEEWDTFLATLKWSHARIKDEVNTLLWTINFILFNVLYRANPCLIVSNYLKKQRRVDEKKEMIDKKSDWAFYDGACQGNPSIYGAGGSFI
eukprot:Gb_33895 [translate_table: standard]